MVAQTMCKEKPANMPTDNLDQQLTTDDPFNAAAPTAPPRRSTALRSAPAAEADRQHATNTMSARNHEPASYWHATAPRSTIRPADPPPTADVAIIGGGLLGSATAYWVARAGASVALLEAAT